jgi:very-short-patch-repair endonuclease
MKKRKGIRNKAAPWKKEYAKKLAKNLTGSEKKLWNILKDKLNDATFYKQSIVYGYIIDFWCPSAKLAIEVDGSVHLNQLSCDASRDTNLAKYGIKTVRFKNEDVDTNILKVIDIIEKEIDKRRG